MSDLVNYTELLPPLPELTDQQLADALAEVWADWLMDSNDEHGQPNAIRHVAKAAIAAAAPAIRKAEREMCANLAVDIASHAAKQYTDNPVRQPYANNRLMHVGWSTAEAIRALPDI